MIFHYLKLALRNFISQKFFSLINLFGLTAGITSTLLILLYVTHETSYDTFHPESDRIYKIAGKLSYGENVMNISGLSAGFGPTVAENDTRVENYVRTYVPNEVVIESEAEAYFENEVIFADPSFLSVFNFPIETGKASELNEPGKVFITNQIAEKYFDTRDVIGKVINYDGAVDLTVAGIIKAPPSNTSLNFQLLISFKTLSQVDEMRSFIEDERMRLGAFITYLKANQDDAKRDIEQTITSLNEDEQTSYSLTPITEIHLSKDQDATAARNVYIFLVTGILILVLALINYLNLTTARATLRAKEVGIRKVVGAGKTTLSVQFFLESSLMIITSFLISLVLVYIITPSLVTFLGKDLSIAYLLTPTYILTSLVVLVVSIILAGTYPAFVLNKFQPVKVLKGNLSGKGEGSWIQKSFATFQFAISVGLILCTLVVSEQLNYIKKYNLGFDKDQLMVVKIPASQGIGYDQLKNNLRSLSGISNVSTASLNMFKGGYAMFFTRNQKTEEDISLAYIKADENFVKTLDLEWQVEPIEPLVPGGFYINEVALEKVGDLDDPLSSEIALGGNRSTVQGVLKDFNYASLKSAIGALVIQIEPDSSKAIVANGAHLYLKLEQGIRLDEKVEEIGAMVNEYQPDVPFDYYFLDDAFNNLYQSESRLATLFQTFSLLAIFIACIGLFGLITFSMERRYKEIGIRKVLGAQTFQIIRMVFLEYIWLFVISIIVAIPVAWWVMDQWLMSFNYKIDVPIWIAIISALIVFVLGFLTISYKSWRASQKDPVDSLRYE